MASVLFVVRDRYKRREDSCHFSASFQGIAPRSRIRVQASSPAVRASQPAKVAESASTCAFILTVPEMCMLFVVSTMKQDLRQVTLAHCEKKARKILLAVYAPKVDHIFPLLCKTAVWPKADPKQDRGQASRRQGGLKQQALPSAKLAS